MPRNMINAAVQTTIHKCQPVSSTRVDERNGPCTNIQDGLAEFPGCDAARLTTQIIRVTGEASLEISSLPIAVRPRPSCIMHDS